MNIQGLDYNTQREKLVMPEYGREIQKMVDYAVALPDKEERQRCAESIIEVMARMTPQGHDSVDYEQKLWDHLAIISGFKLDIDWPFEEVITEQSLTPKPEAVPYDTGIIGLRQYGRNIESMVAMIADMEEGRDRYELVTMIANQMKKNLLAANRDDNVDERILKDLYDMSGGKIRLNPGDIRLHEYNIVEPATKKKKKK